MTPTVHMKKLKKNYSYEQCGQFGILGENLTTFRISTLKNGIRIEY